MLGYTQMLRANVSDEGRRAQVLETIERNARTQEQLIAEVLDVSRIITGKMRLDVRPVDLAQVIEQAIDTVRPAAEAKGVRIQPVLDRPGAPVAGDAQRLQQVAWNLLSNAVKFTPRGGRVQVRLGRADSHVEVVVSDTGEGSRPSSRRICSSASARPTGRRRAPTAASGSAWRSAATSSKPTAAASRPRVRAKGSARRSRWSCRC